MGRRSADGEGKVREVAGDYSRTVAFQDSMKNTKLSLDRGYAVIGIARGNGVLTSNQMGVAIDEWRTSRHDSEHKFHSEHDNAYGLYNAFTHGLKLGHVGRKIDEYTGASKLFEDLGYAVVSDAEIV